MGQRAKACSQQWFNAQAAGDQAGMHAAHTAANAIRYGGAGSPTTPGMGAYPPGVWDILAWAIQQTQPGLTYEEAMQTAEAWLARIDILRPLLGGKSNKTPAPENPTPEPPPPGMTAADEHGYRGIYDLTAYINYAHGSGWTLSKRVTLEPDIQNFLMSELEAGVGNCTLTALTRVFAYYRDTEGKVNIPNNKTLYNDIKSIAEGYGYSDGGTSPTKINNIINDVFAKYGYAGKGSSSYIPWLLTALDELDNGRPILMNIAFGYYAKHTVTVVGYSVFTRDDEAIIFLKVHGGWSKGNRYIDWQTYATLFSFSMVRFE